MTTIVVHDVHSVIKHTIVDKLQAGQATHHALVARDALTKLGEELPISAPDYSKDLILAAVKDVDHVLEYLAVETNYSDVSLGGGK